jgi:membrane-bound metal-dependent hydrolase YbcI (DUF457 family)
MPSPLGHLMAGAMIGFAGQLDTANAAEPAPPSARVPIVGLVRQSLTPLVVVCATLGASPDLDMLVHTHRTWSHSLGAAGVVWAMAAVVAWRLRLPVLRVATICASAYASHVFLDWLAYPDSPTSGPMALWPFSHRHYSSGLDLFLELRPRTRWGLRGLVRGNAHALAREFIGRIGAGVRRCRPAFPSPNIRYWTGGGRTPSPASAPASAVTQGRL